MQVQFLPLQPDGTDIKSYFTNFEFATTLLVLDVRQIKINIKGTYEHRYFALLMPWSLVQIQSGGFPQ